MLMNPDITIEIQDVETEMVDDAEDVRTGMDVMTETDLVAAGVENATGRDEVDTNFRGSFSI